MPPLLSVFDSHLYHFRMLYWNKPVFIKYLPWKMNSIRFADASEKILATFKKMFSVAFMCFAPWTCASLMAQPIISNDVFPYFEIQARIRCGDWAFESSLNIFTPPGEPGSGQWQMNPKGSPVWNSYGNTYGDIHSFVLTYTAATGLIVWQIDFNRDGDYGDYQESKSMPVAAFAGKGFNYINVYGQGNNNGLTASLTDLTINDVNFGDYSSSTETPFSILFEEASGIFTDIVVTGQFSLSGNGGFERPRIWVRLGEANTAPTCSIISPLQNTVYSGVDSIQIEAIATDPDGEISKVEFYANNVKLGEDYTSPYQFPWVDIPEGSYSLTAKATDDLGTTITSSPVMVVFSNNTSPICYIANPLDGATLFDPDTLIIEVESNDPDDGVMMVAFFIDSTLIENDSVSPYRSSALVNPPMGQYMISARSTDMSGFTSTAAPVFITIRCIREDIDNNGTVNTLDFLFLLSAFGRPCSDCPEDFNLDGAVSTIDFLRILSVFGYTCN